MDAELHAPDPHCLHQFPVVTAAADIVEGPYPTYVSYQGTGKVVPVVTAYFASRWAWQQHKVANHITCHWELQ